MKTAYLAISYKCNQNCSFCPCSKEEHSYPFVELESLKEVAGKMTRENNVDMIVISGGEPTIHPHFIELIRYILLDCNCSITILSNGENYYRPEFVKKIAELNASDRITCITTLHSQDASEHEEINGSRGSLMRSVEGLKNMFGIGADIIVKHCITKKNYEDLTKFYDFIDETFDEKVSLQLCSIDYCGLTQEELDSHMLSFVELRPHLEEMFDHYIEKCENGSKRHLYAINMPFCSCDPYYWNILVGREDTYSTYASPNNSGQVLKKDNVENNVDTFGEGCRNCQAREICPGTYKTAFECFGDRIIEPYLE